MVENINIKKSTILGIYGNTSKELIESICLGKTTINNSNYDICYINGEKAFLTTTVMKEINYYDNRDKVLNIIHELGLSEDILTKSIFELSNSEKYFIRLALDIIETSNVFVFKNIFENMDFSNKKRLKALLRRLKLDDRIIIIESNNIDLLQEIMDDLLIMKNGNILIQETTEELYNKHINVLIDNNIPIPTICQITYKALKEKNIKLFYHNDVRDIIKDIYKHV